MLTIDWTHDSRVPFFIHDTSNSYKSNYRHWKGRGTRDAERAPPYSILVECVCTLRYTHLLMVSLGLTFNLSGNLGGI